MAGRSRHGAADPPALQPPKGGSKPPEEIPRWSTELLTLEAAAEKRLTTRRIHYVARGAGSGVTMRANRAAFDDVALVPRMLRDVGKRDLSMTVRGTRMTAPVLLAPIGVQSIVHDEGDLAAALTRTTSSHPPTPATPDTAPPADPG